MDTDTTQRKRTKPLKFKVATTAPYQAHCYPPGHSLLIGEPSGFHDRLSRIVDAHTAVERVFLPDVEHMSGRLASPEEFALDTTLPSGTEVYQTASPSDLVAIRPREGVLFRAGGCLLVVATGGDYCVAGHAGRDSLIDLTGVRTPQTAVHAIAEYFEHKGVALADVMVRAYFGIQPDVFTHDPNYPALGAYYRQVLEHIQNLQERVEERARRLAIRQWPENEKIVRVRDGLPHLSLYHLLKAQAILLGITNTGCEKPLPIDGGFAYTRHTDQRLADDRNWVLAYRI